jgi:REP element-mobilizing transposase RayT
VTTRILGGLPSLRTNRAFGAIRRSIARGHKVGFRVVHFSVMGNHVHLLVEALNKEALAAGMKGLKVRIARALNRTWQRKGTVFAERYHARELSTPRETRHGLSYCLNNYRRHQSQVRRTMPDGWLDPRSSARQFDGWNRDVATEPGVVVPAQSWLLRSGWRRAGGALDPNAVPGPGPQ